MVKPCGDRVLGDGDQYSDTTQVQGMSEILLAHLSYSTSQFSMGVDIALYYQLSCTNFVACTSKGQTLRENELITTDVAYVLYLFNIILPFFHPQLCFTLPSPWGRSLVLCSNFLCIKRTSRLPQYGSLISSRTSVCTSRREHSVRVMSAL